MTWTVVRDGNTRRAIAIISKQVTEVMLRDLKVREWVDFISFPLSLD